MRKVAVVCVGKELKLGVGARIERAAGDLFSLRAGEFQVQVLV